MLHVEKKPIKVQDTKLTDINVNLNNTLKTLSNLLEKQKPLGIKNENELLINKNYGISPKIPHLDSESLPTHPDSPQEISSFSPLRTQDLDSDVSLKTPSNWKSADKPFLSDDTQDSNDPTSPLPDAQDPYFFNNLFARRDQTTPLNRNVRERVSKKDIDARKSEKLAKHLLQTQEYGFKEDGQLISPKSKRPVKESSHKDIADYAINTLGKFTPPGFKKIRKQLNEDPVVQRIRSNSAGRFSVKDWETY